MVPVLAQEALPPRVGPGYGSGVYVSGGEVLYSGCMYLEVRFYTVGVCIWG